MGASSSHLAMTGGPSGIWHPPAGGPAALSTAEATARGEVQVPVAGGRLLGTGRAKGVPAEYPTAPKPPLGDNAAFVSGVQAGVQAEPHPSRTRLSPGESAGARLTVSPSMKIPQESPVPTQGQGRIVPSQPSRQGSFATGQSEAGWG